jgi:hypothetical protein
MVSDDLMSCCAFSFLRKTAAQKNFSKGILST